MLLRSVLKIAIASSILLGSTTVCYAESFKLTPEKAIPIEGEAVKFHYSASAGDIIEDSLHITRKLLYGQPPTVNVNYFAVDAQMTQDGFIGMASEFDTQNNVGAWVKLGKNSETISYESDIPFRIEIPQNTTPGQYIGGFVMTEIEEDDTTSTAQGNLTKVRLRYATSVRVDVKGEINTNFEIENIAYNITNGNLQTSFDFINTGNVIHEFSGFYELDGFFKTKKIEIPLKKALPGETVHFETFETGILDLFGGFAADLHIKTQVNFANGSQSEDFDQTDHINYFPPTPILVLLFIFLVIYGIIHRIIVNRFHPTNDPKNFFKNNRRNKI